MNVRESVGGKHAFFHETHLHFYVALSHSWGGYVQVYERVATISV